MGEGKRIRDVIDFLSFEELQKMKRDLDSGGFHLLRLVKHKIQENERSHKQFCSFCGAQLDMQSIHNYTVVFGPYDFRKKASFCGTDCLLSFFRNLNGLQSNTSLNEVQK